MPMSADLSNPFRGMNPWLTLHWHSVHARFITYACDQISAQLPAGLAALTEERVTIENVGDATRRFIGPDIAIDEAWKGGGGGLHGSENGDVALAEPIISMLEDPVERCIEIVAASGALITAVELLSESNKSDLKGTRAYLEKQQTYQEAGVNLVEIDLICRGEHVLRAPERYFQNDPPTPYGISVWRARDPKHVAAYPIQWQQRLPKIPIPLREDEPEATLDLQPVLDEVFLKGRYAYLIRYSKSHFRPPLPDDVQAWAEDVLREKGLLPA